MTKYKKIKRFINKQPIDSIIQRQDLLNATGETKRNDVTTTDNYRKMFAIIGVLEETKTRGRYRVKQHIGENLTIKLLTMMAYKPDKLLTRNISWIEEVFVKK